MVLLDRKDHLVKKVNLDQLVLLEARANKESKEHLGHKVQEVQQDLKEKRDLLDQWVIQVQWVTPVHLANQDPRDHQDLTVRETIFLSFIFHL